MTAEERQLITELFDRLKRIADGSVEAEAQTLIDASVAAHPIAPYRMVQLLLMQERALAAAQGQIRALQQEQATTAASSHPTGGDSFLGRFGQRGPWGDARGAAPAPPPPISPQPPASISGMGGGFLRGAWQTAAGVAGGALLFESINSLLHWDNGVRSTGGFLPSHVSPSDAPVFLEPTIAQEYREPSTAPGDAATFIADDAAAAPESPVSSESPVSFESRDPQTGSLDWSDERFDRI